MCKKNMKIESINSAKWVELELYDKTIVLNTGKHIGTLAQT